MLINKFNKTFFGFGSRSPAQKRGIFYFNFVGTPKINPASESKHGKVKKSHFTRSFVVF